jgi:signal transduction histidine kinase
VNSTAGSGSTFRIILPVQAERPAHP